MLAPKEGRRESIAKDISETLVNTRLSPGDAKTLAGRFIHYASTCAGRVGKGILHFVSEQASEEGPRWSEGLRFNLLFQLGCTKSDSTCPSLSQEGQTLDRRKLSCGLRRSPYLQIVWDNRP